MNIAGNNRNVYVTETESISATCVYPANNELINQYIISISANYIVQDTNENEIILQTSKDKYCI